MSSWLTGSALKQHVVATHHRASFTQSAVAAATPLGHQERHLLITQLSKTFLRAKSCCSFCFFATKSCCSFCSNTISSHVILHFRLDLKKKGLDHRILILFCLLAQTQVKTFGISHSFSWLWYNRIYQFKWCCIFVPNIWENCKINWKHEFDTVVETKTVEN